MTRNSGRGLVRGFAGVLTAVLIGCPSYAAPSYTVPVLNGSAANSGLVSLPSTVYDGGTGRATETVRTNANAILNWSSFDISSNAGINFQQPSSGSVALNRISGSASQIFGNISSNGKLILVNQQGIHFASGSSVNVAGLIATTSDISDADFNNGVYRFEGGVSIGSGSPTIENEGTIQTIQDGGLVALVAPTVVNSGTIVATAGTVTLASGSAYTVDLFGDGLIRFEAGDALASQLVRNSGVINANGGKVVMTASAVAAETDSLINMDGIIQADAVVDVDGKVLLSAGSVDLNAGTVAVSGIISASNIGEEVLTPGATLNGGTVSVAGQNVSVSSDALIAVDSDNGSGGSVAVSGDQVYFNGTINARGGEHGGFVTTEGESRLIVTGAVNATGSAGGMNGVWTLSSNEMTIADVDYFAFDGGYLDGSFVSAASVGDALSNGTDVTASTSAGSIFIGGSVIKLGDKRSVFALESAEDITLDQGMFVSSSGSALDVEFNAEASSGSIVLTEDSSVASNGGNVLFGSGAVSMLDSSSIFSNGGNISIGGDNGAVGNENNGVGVRLDGATLASAGGDISILGKGYAYGQDGNAGVSLEHGSVIETSGNGTISIDGYGAGSGSYNRGVSMSWGSAVYSDAGNIGIHGIGGGNDSSIDVTGNDGVAITDGAFIYSGSGSIELSGTGGGNGAGFADSNVGLRISEGSAVYTGGAISLAGIGGGNDSEYGLGNYGILINNGSSVESSSSSGSGIEAFGVGGGNGVFLGYDNVGLAVYNGSRMYASGGDVSVFGIGGGNGAMDSGNNYGVSVFADSSIGAGAISSGYDEVARFVSAPSPVGGNVSVLGSGGGNGAYSSEYNHGIDLESTSFISSDSGSVILGGAGGGNYSYGSSSYNDGVHVSAGAGVSSVSGDITVYGTGGGLGSLGGGSGEVAFALREGSEIGEGSFVEYNNGVHLSEGGFVHSGEGDIGITGVAGGSSVDSNFGILAESGAMVGGNGAVGRIVFTTDTISFDDSVSVDTEGNVTFLPYTNTTDISVGETYGMGLLQLTGTVLSDVRASSITIGSLDDSGLITVGDYSDWTDPVQSVSMLNGSGDIVFNGVMSMGNRELLANTSYGNISIGSSGSVSSTRTYGTSITLAASEGNFTNYSGAGGNALSTGDGSRWLIYSGGPVTNEFGGLVSDFHRYSCVYDGTCPVSIQASGNGFIYSVTPTLSVSLHDHVTTYGTSLDVSDYSTAEESYYFHGVRYVMDSSSMDTPDVVFSATGVGGSTVLDSSARLNAGSYAVTAEDYAAANIGYNFEVVTDASSLLVNPAALSVEAYSYYVPFGIMAPSPFKYSVVDGLQYEDAQSDVSFSGALTSTAPSANIPSGAYSIELGTLVASGNYTIGDYIPGTMTVGTTIEGLESVLEFRPNYSSNRRSFSGTLLAIAGGTGDLADLAPNAGGDEPSDLADLSPAAGGDSTPLIQCNDSTPCDITQ